MAYTYDVVVRYGHLGEVPTRVHGTFLPMFTRRLAQALGRPSEVFVDRSGIESGAEWPASLQRALVSSRVLVAVWDRGYFNSAWCTAEVDSMREREAQLGWRSVDDPRGLILPVRVHDGDKFPEWAKRIQHRDWGDYFWTSPAARQSREFHELEKEVRGFADEVAELIEAPTFPAWRDSFPLLLPKVMHDGHLPMPRFG